MTENDDISNKATDAQWIKFLKYLSLSLGSGFMLCGVIFFFAYNWSEMHHFVKFAIVGFLLLGCYAGMFFAKKNSLVQNVLITSMCVIVGIFIALFGQVYQMEADSYMIFLIWALAILAWTVVADFYPLWLFFIALVITSIQLTVGYRSQIATIIGPLVLLVISASFLYAPKIFSKRDVPPAWFMSAIITIMYSWNIIISIFNVANWILYFVITALVYFYSTQNKNLWTYMLLFLGFICVFFRLTDISSDFLIIYPSAIIIYTFFVAKHLIKKHNEWNNKNGDEQKQ